MTSTLTIVNNMKNYIYQKMDVPTSNLDIEMNTCITINYVGQLKKKLLDEME